MCNPNPGLHLGLGCLCTSRKPAKRDHQEISRSAAATRALRASPSFLFFCFCTAARGREPRSASFDFHRGPEQLEGSFPRRPRPCQGTLYTNTTAVRVRTHSTLQRPIDRHQWRAGAQGPSVAAVPIQSNPVVLNLRELKSRAPLPYGPVHSSTFNSVIVRP